MIGVLSTSGYITFSAGEGFQFPSYFGLISRETKEIFWSEQCESGRYLVEAPQLHENKLYIRDSENTLAIFEKSTV